MRLATIEGLDGLSIGNLARATEHSKSGVYAHFDSKEELQLATIDTARTLFIDAVVRPTLHESGLDRLRALCESFLTYVEQRTLPGGCFFAAAAAELGGRPGALRERVAANQHDWIALLTHAADEAVTDGQLRADTDVTTLVFELNALVIAANTAFILHDDPAVIDRARIAVARVIVSARPANPGPDNLWCRTFETPSLAATEHAMPLRGPWGSLVLPSALRTSAGERRKVATSGRAPRMRACGCIQRAASSNSGDSVTTPSTCQYQPARRGRSASARIRRPAAVPIRLPVRGGSVR